mgnify:FL=1
MKEGIFMKSRWKQMCIFLVLILSMIGCGQKETEPKEEQTQTEDTKEEGSTQETQQKEESTQSAEPEQGSQSQKEIKIYFANKDASGFETEEVAMEDVSAEKIWEQLVAKGVVPADTQVISCTEKTIDGEKALQLDLSEKFSTYLNGQGSSGEYLTVGCICNTFLDAFDGESIRITVDGKKLETGHAEYPGYLSKYEIRIEGFRKSMSEK